MFIREETRQGKWEIWGDQVLDQVLEPFWCSAVEPGCCKRLQLSVSKASSGGDVSMEAGVPVGAHLSSPQTLTPWTFTSQSGGVSDDISNVLPPDELLSRGDSGGSSAQMFLWSCDLLL